MKRIIEYYRDIFQNILFEFIFEQDIKLKVYYILMSHYVKCQQCNSRSEGYNVP